MQTNLKALFAGRREVATVPPKRGPGRPPKVRENTAEEPDVVLSTLQDQPEAYAESSIRGRKKKLHRLQNGVSNWCESLGKAVGDLRMPGFASREGMHEGPQVKLRLCRWMENYHEAMGGTSEAWDKVVRGVAEAWGDHVADISKIMEQKTTWARQCEERGVGADGLTDEV